MKIKIVVNFNSLNGLGFARYRSDKKKKKEITFDINAMLNCCVDNPEIDFKEFFTKTFVHELLHFFEDFTDDEIKEEDKRHREELEKRRQKYKKSKGLKGSMF